ncbi:hypothetical protein LCGC14_0387370 [marine sediment metagenome]|uniref:Uncharacterized protein n=1 Tax=marine sediment metagenome TaxID=412755 RepID=A0A0F9T0F5_9ZZZZ
MILTKKKAIDLSIELWEFLTKTGKEKGDWSEWGKYQKYASNKQGVIDRRCFLCEYNEHKGGGSHCSACSYMERFGHCNHEGHYYNSWDKTRTPRTRKKYAKLFLEQLYQLRSKK